MKWLQNYLNINFEQHVLSIHVVYWLQLLCDGLLFGKTVLTSISHSRLISEMQGYALLYLSIA